MKKLAQFTLVMLAAAVVVTDGTRAELSDPQQEYLLKMVEKDLKDEFPSQKIYLKNGALYCTGTSNASLANNRAAGLMEAGDYKSAIDVLEKALTQAPLFFPFRYNLGVCFIYENRLKESMLNFQKAEAMVPEFPKLYLQKGYIYQRWNMVNNAIDEFRKAYKKNAKELDAFINIGNIYYDRNQFEAAKKYYDAALAVDNLYPNGLLGNAKIHFKKKEWIKTIVLLKSIDLAKDYDKSLHYYFAEAYYKLRDYKNAYHQYKKLLDFKNDKFFLTTSANLIMHKLELAKRFVDEF